MAPTTHTELISQQEWTALKERLHLPPQQAEIVRLIMEGKADKQIARELGISMPTVRTHISRLFRRFDLNDRVELILYMFKQFREHSFDGH